MRRWISECLCPKSTASAAVTIGSTYSLPSENGHPNGSLNSVFSCIWLGYHFRIPNSILRGWVSNGIERPSTTGCRKSAYRPTSDAAPDHIAVDKTVIQVNDERRWLYAAVNPETNEFLHVRLSPTRTTQPTVLFLCELQQHVPVIQATILINDAHHLKAALSRLGLRFQMRRHGNRNAVERASRDVKRRTSSFSNTFGHVQPTTAE